MGKQKAISLQFLAWKNSNYLVFSLPSTASIQAQHISLKAKMVKL